MTPTSSHPIWNRQTRAAYLDEAKKTLGLAWPLILSQIAQVAFQTTDVIMLGWVGPQSLAGMSLALALLHPLLVGGFGVVSATAPMVAQALGARDLKSVRRTVRQGLWISILLSVLIMPVLLVSDRILPLLGQPEPIVKLASAYLDVAAFGILPALSFMVMRLFISAKGNTRAILGITLIAVTLNIALNYVLIFGHLGLPALGVVGAALATALSNWILFVLGAIYAVRHPKYRRHHVFIRFLKPDWPRFFEFFHIGLPVGATNVAEVGLFGFAVFMMGWIGTEAVAAHAVAVQCASISFMVPLGLSHATTIRVGHARGAGDVAGAGRAGWVSLAMALMFMATTCALFILVPEHLAGLFLDAHRPENASTIALAASFLVVAGLFQFFDGTQVAMSAALRGLSDTRVPMILALVGYWVVGLSIGYGCAFLLGWGGIGVWAGLAAGLGFAAIAMTMRWSRREELGLLALPSRA